MNESGQLESAIKAPPSPRQSIYRRTHAIQWLVGDRMHNETRSPRQVSTEIRLVLTDWNGPINYDGYTSCEANNRLLEFYGRPRLTHDEWRLASKTSAASFLEGQGIAIENHKE